MLIENPTGGKQGREREACTVRLTANLRHRETAQPDRKPERSAPPSGSYCPSGSGISDKPECIMKNTLCREALQ